MAFQILADVAKTNVDILETIQLLAQGKKKDISNLFVLFI
jgi:hypothetical protein